MEEFSAVLRKSGEEITKELIEELFYILDEDNDGLIDYDEFRNNFDHLK